MCLDTQDDDAVQCSTMAASTNKRLSEPDAPDAVVTASSDVATEAGEVTDSFKMEDLCSPPALVQLVKYPPLHIFVSIVVSMMSRSRRTLIILILC